MFRNLAILAVAALACVNAVDTKVETALLEKLVRYEAEKAAALSELAAIEKIVASMSSTKVEVSAPSTGSSSGASETTVGSTSGGEDYTIGTLPPITTAPAPTAENEAGSLASSATVTTAPATTAPASAATVNHVAPVAVAVVAAAIALL